MRHPCPILPVSQLQGASFIKATVKIVSLKVMSLSTPSRAPLLWGSGERPWEVRYDPTMGHTRLLSGTRPRAVCSVSVVPRERKPRARAARPEQVLRDISVAARSLISGTTLHLQPQMSWRQ